MIIYSMTGNIVAEKVISATVETMNFIQENHDNPFFVNYATTLPHSNGEAPENEKYEIPDWGKYADSSWLPYEKGYAAMVTKLDTQMGKIIAKLKELGIDKNTLILFTSDNGPTCRKFVPT